MTFDEWYATQKHHLSNEPVCRAIWNVAVTAEREACAGACESVDAEHIVGANEHYLAGRAMAVQRCARAIRMRSNVEVRRGAQATPQSADIKTVASTAGLATSQHLKD